MKKLTQMILGSIPALFLVQGLAIAAPETTQDEEMIVISENTDKDAAEHKDAKETKSTTLSDTEITAKVKAKFLEEKLIDDKNVAAFKVHVKTKKGVVHLSGKVTEQAQADNAVKYAKEVEGVKDVKSTITVKPAKK